MRGDSGPPWRRRTAARRPAGHTGRARHSRRSALEHLRQHRHHARLVALAGDGDARRPCRVRGTSLRLKPERLGNAQARAVEQRQHGGVARENPGLALLAGAQVGVGDALRARRPASGFGRVFAIFGARTAASAPTLPLPLRSRKRANERAPASMRISERPPMPSARRAAMKARTSLRRAVAPEPLERDARRRDARRGKSRNWRDVARDRPRPSWATSAARPRDSASQLAELRPRTIGRGERAVPVSVPTVLTRDCLISPLLHIHRFLNRPESGKIRASRLIRTMAQTHRRCAGAGRARPGLFLPGAGRA